MFERSSKGWGKISIADEMWNKRAKTKSTPLPIILPSSLFLWPTERSLSLFHSLSSPRWPCLLLNGRGRIGLVTSSVLARVCLAQREKEREAINQLFVWFWTEAWIFSKREKKRHPYKLPRNSLWCYITRFMEVQHTTFEMYTQRITSPKSR